MTLINYLPMMWVVETPRGASLHGREYAEYWGINTSKQT